MEKDKIIEVIKYEGDNSTFVWKHPCEDFSSLTQLIVHQSQEAVFMMNGEALDTFGAGRYTLETQNIPRVSSFLKRTTGDKTPFHCEVYFINKTVQMGIKWGVQQISFIDPNFGIPVSIGASGEINLTVSDSRRLLERLVGTMNGIAWGERGQGFTKSLQGSFFPMICTAVKTHLADAIVEGGINILDIDRQLEALSSVLRTAINPGFEEYGLSVPELYVSNVSLPENDKSFNRLRELHTVALQTKMAEAEATITVAMRQAELERQATQTEIARAEAQRQIIKAQTEAEASKIAGFAEAQVMQAKGYNQKDVLQAEVQKAYAEGIGNMGSGTGSGSGVVGDFVGLGVGIAAAQNIGAQMGDMFKGVGTAPTQPSAITCVKCGSTLSSNAKFCVECGTRVQSLGTDEILCPSCGSKTLKGKFCSECGVSLVTKCPKCDTELSTGAKFCLNCGEKL